MLLYQNRTTAFAAFFALVCCATSSGAQAPNISTISAAEHGLGASPLHMVAGHGRLTVGVARDSDIAVLTWPSLLAATN